MKKLFTIFLIIIAYNSSFAQVWSDDFNGIDSIWNNSAPTEVHPISMNHIYSYNDSILYMAGVFAYVNADEAHGIAKWDSHNIFNFENGVTIGSTRAIIKYKDTLYIGGTFHSASNHPNTSNLAVWNGHSWQSTSIGQPDSDVYDFCIYHDTLFVAGNFGHIGNLTYKKIAAYNGEEWINVGDMGMWTKALAVFNDELYAGGYWGVRKYLGGTEWETLNPSPDGYVNELMVDTINSLLFVGGEFFHIGNELSICTAIWDGFNWISTGGVSSTTVWPQASAFYRGEFYTGNGVVVEDNVWTSWIKKWNGEAWDSIGGAFSSTIFALEVFRDTLYIGGAFGFWGGDSPVPDKRNKGMVKLYMPDNGCDYLRPIVYAYEEFGTAKDTFYLNNGQATVNFYNNNAYADAWQWDFGDGISNSTEKCPVYTYNYPGTYNVNVTVTQDQCVKTAQKTITVYLNTNTEQLSTNNYFEVFPNPTKDKANIKCFVPQEINNAEIIILTTNGQILHNIKLDKGLNNLSIDLSKWKTDIVIINILFDNERKHSEKLIIRK